MAGFQLNLVLSEGLSAVPEILNRTHRELELAAARALRKTANWLRSASTKEIARELRISQSPMRHRFDVYSRAAGKEVKIWVGLRPIAVHYLGTPKETPTGVSVGHRAYEDAFIAQRKSGAPMVWARKGRERLPIDLVREDWEGPALTVLERWEKRAQERFVELFEQEARNVLESSK